MYFSSATQVKRIHISFEETLCACVVITMSVQCSYAGRHTLGGAECKQTVTVTHMQTPGSVEQMCQILYQQQHSRRFFFFVAFSSMPLSKPANHLPAYSALVVVLGSQCSAAQIFTKIPRFLLMAVIG